MADKLWKRAEREIAERIGGKRVPVTGRGRGSEPDIRHEWLSVEVKSRNSIPAWIKDAMAQAVASIRGDQLPIVVIHENGARYDDALVMVPLKDFTLWFGDAREPGETGE